MSCTTLRQSHVYCMSSQDPIGKRNTTGYGWKQGTPKLVGLTVKLTSNLQFHLGPSVLTHSQNCWRPISWCGGYTVARGAGARPWLMWSQELMNDGNRTSNSLRFLALSLTAIDTATPAFRWSQGRNYAVCVRPLVAQARPKFEGFGGQPKA